MTRPSRMYLQEGWVIANHILVSVHVAFISSVLSLPALSMAKADVLRFIFTSPETLISAWFVYVSFHSGIAVHELGHYLTAARLNALDDRSQRAAAPVLHGSLLRRVWHLARMFAQAPYGKATGIKREGLNYYPDAPYNLAVAAAGPRASRNLALVSLLPAVLLLTPGIMFGVAWAIYLGRLALGIGIVGLLDFLLADRGKYAEFKTREQRAREKAATVTTAAGWWEGVAEAKQRMLGGRIQSLVHPVLGPVTAPWQFRNCGMGGRHTEREYPESNISMQEAMFLILGARDYQEAQEMTVRLQNRLKEIIENEEGCRVMGIGLEGGLAPYIDRGAYALPEVRLWVLMRQTIVECGYQPGVDVAIALDPAMSELELAYRRQFKVPDSVGMYLFWRDKTQTVMDRDGVLDLYLTAMREHDVPILSIEDGFSEDDAEGWQKLLSALGERIFVIGDDLVTTNDRTIEEAADRGLINTVLVKANQIGTLYETLLAMLVSLGKGLELVVSHRSKSPNDDMEAQIALAVNALGLKAGGGANTERLMKYHAVTELMQRGLGDSKARELGPGLRPMVSKLYAYEEPTNAGLPTVGATVELDLAAQGLHLTFKGATPLGTSAGTGEAIHLVDSAIEASEHREVIARHAGFFAEQEPGVVAFARHVKAPQVRATGDEDLIRVFERAQRYEGKGCLNAVHNVKSVIAPAFDGTLVSDLSLIDIDRLLLSLELREARRRMKIDASASAFECIQVMQRKQNLGMNAILSVSLAMARATAHLRGKDLFEFLREEMLAIVERLARTHGVEIAGSHVSDYTMALRRVNAVLAGRGETLYGALRDLTGVYDIQGVEPVHRQSADTGDVVPVPDSARTQADGEAALSRVGAALHESRAEDPAAPASPPAEAATPSSILTDTERDAIAALNDGLYRAFHAAPDPVQREAVMRQYVALKESIAARLGSFGLANNRIYQGATQVLVPYLLGETLLVYRAPDDDGAPMTAFVRRGAIITDAWVTRLAEFDGTPVDLEGELFELNPDRCTPAGVGRVRDMAAQLHRIAGSANRADAVFLLRILVAQLSLFSFKKYLSATNLQAEVRTLLAELLNFLNSPLSYRMPFLVRILVRSISGVVTKPTLIDRLWNDTIDLAEVHLRGSDIVNEIRRSTHHAVGKRTLRLAQAYLEYLESGNMEGLIPFGFAEPGQADEDARQETRPRQLVARIVDDLEELMGSADVLRRVRDWQATYEAALLQCESETNVLDEVEKAVADGIAERNRWTFYHHIRVIRNYVSRFPRLAGHGLAARDRLDALLTLEVDAPDVDARAAESDLRRCVEDFTGAVRAAYQERLFEAMTQVSVALHQRDYMGSFTRICELRRDLRAGLNERAFPEQRLLLYRLDCLLEEMGYVALRQVASQYEDQAVDLQECLEVIRACALNLTHDGLHSRQLLDLVGILADRPRSYAELADVLHQIRRNYQHIVRQLVAPFERMRGRAGLDAEELRIALANMQRVQHDLNSMAFFADIALTYLEHHDDDRQGTRDSEAAHAADAADSIVHLSHRHDIARLVRDGESVRNVRASYGGKGAGLLYISHLNLPTPDGFVIPTAAARRRSREGGDTWCRNALHEHLAILEADVARTRGTNQRFGSPEQPLLLAVRGGSMLSMPGMLSTVLFVGMNDEIASTLADVDPWHAYDSYRRFLATYGQAVWGVDVERYNLVEESKIRHGAKYKHALPWEAMQEVVEATKEALRGEGHGEALARALNDPFQQLEAAVGAVMDSWNHPTARRYRDLKGICDSWQTAVVVQEMASGNRRNEDVRIGMDETKASLTGVIPRTSVTDLGVRECTGEFKFSACGEDLVGGLMTRESVLPLQQLATYMPMLDRRIRHTVTKLRRFMGTDQEVEFTVDGGVLSVLQSRAADIGTNSRSFAFSAPGGEAARGIGIRGGAFRGVVAFDEADCAELRATDAMGRDDVDGILMVLENPTPADIPLVLLADGLLTAKGGSTSHAAVAINGIEDKDYSAVMSANWLRVRARTHEAVLVDAQGHETARIRKGDVVSIHGSSGMVYLGPRQIERA